MDSLPIDMSHPAVRDYLALVRLQVLTPLSLPHKYRVRLGTISKLNPTSISPRPAVISVYVAAMYLGQIGYCLLLVLARKPETKRTITKGVGLSLVFANWLMAMWAVAWVFEWFIIATVLEGLQVILLLYSNISLLTYHSLNLTKRPLDMALIHAPLRFFFVLQLMLVFPLTLFIALGLTTPPLYDGTPADYNAHMWAGFGVVFGTNLVSLLVIVLRRDIVWCVAATWICVSIWALRPKPQPVYITVLVFTIIHPLSLIMAFIHAYFYTRSEVDGNGNGAVVLPGDEHPGLAAAANQPPSERQVQGPREVDPEAVWGE
ncbi:hypothetical protein C8R46DRAFT_1084018 [Mycena filopes]|nr:hypothetical protein C8R46DRAFT_1084018 [Mycena filopes]